MDNDICISKEKYDAVIFDLDGVITKTANIHATAWKQLFDEYLKKRSSDGKKKKMLEPFNIDTDYPRYIDGKPRYDGVRSFLASRQIKLPYGGPDDSPGKETICGLGNKKNEFFLKHLKKQGVQVYEATIKLIQDLRSKNFKIAVISSSKNCSAILDVAKLTHLFDVKVDGVDSQELNLEGKPAPDIFIQAARRLGVTPERAVVVEDAIAGVKAGSRGGFGFVIGVDRRGQGQALMENGADVVVKELSEVRVCKEPPAPEEAVLPFVLDSIGKIREQVKGGRIAVFLDYDGTLTPIVESPEKAVLSNHMRNVVRNLADRCTVGIISGRDLPDVQKMVNIGNIFYAGSHGFDVSGPKDFHIKFQKGVDFLPLLDKIGDKLRGKLNQIPGVLVERKKFSIAVHYRKVKEEKIKQVEKIVDRVLAENSGLQKSYGKKIFELQPKVDWNKGKALLWLFESLKLDKAKVVPVYIGDDTTDEDAFKALQGWGIGILVADELRSTEAQYRLRSPDEVENFLKQLIFLLEEK